MSVKANTTTEVESFPPRVCRLKELRMVGWASVRSARAGYPRHGHRNYKGAYGFLFVCQGNVRFRVGKEVNAIGRGEVYVTRPDELHGTAEGVMGRHAMYWLQVVLPRQGALPGMSIADTRVLKREFDTMRFRCFPVDREIESCFVQIHDECRSPTPLGRIAMRAALHRLLFCVCRDYHAYRERLGTETTARSPRVERCLAWINENLADIADVGDIARMAKFSARQLHDRFVAEVGFAPAEYLARQRVARAKVLLRDGSASVTDIAHRLGFSSSQYFATVFRKFEGMPPSQYRGKR